MDPKVIIAISVVLGVIALVTLPFYLVIIPVIGILYGLWRLTELFVDMRKETRSSANMKRAGYTAGMFVGLMIVLAILLKVLNITDYKSKLSKGFNDITKEFD